MLLAFGAAAAARISPAAEPSPPAFDFDRQIAPLLVARCLECHSGASPEGGLSLVDAEGAAKGGESGPALETGNARSLLLARV